MGIEGCRDGVPLGKYGIVGLGVEQELPQAGNCGFTPSAADDVFLGAKYGNGMFLVEDFADIFSEGANAHKVVGTGLGT